jgi:hypothetical protein
MHVYSHCGGQQQLLVSGKPLRSCCIEAVTRIFVTAFIFPVHLLSLRIAELAYHLLDGRTGLSRAQMAVQ